MKNYEERAKYILEARDKILEERKIKRKKAEKYVSMAAGILFIFIFGDKIYKNILGTEHIPVTDISYETVTSKCMTEITEDKDTVISANEKTEISSQTDNEQKNTVTSEITESEISEYPEASSENHCLKTIITQPNITSIITETQNTEITSVLQSQIAVTEETSFIPMTETVTENVPVYEITTKVTDGATQQIPNVPSLPWDEMTVSQQYSMCEFEGRDYRSAELDIAPDRIGERLGEAYMSGYDDRTDTYCHCFAEIFMINNKDADKQIAVRFNENENFYLYINCTLLADNSDMETTE